MLSTNFCRQLGTVPPAIRHALVRTLSAIPTPKSNFSLARHRRRVSSKLFRNGSIRQHSTLRELFQGNLDYISNMSKDHPNLLSTLAKEGQRPPFLLVDCSDSRVNESAIFSAKPGTMFTAGNIANRFDETDQNSNAILSFAVESLKVKHVVVMGHYGCGGVAASMMSLPENPTKAADVAVQSWISPIRQIYLTSKRKEIVDHRTQTQMKPLTELPDLHDIAFRALVEENVKSNVEKIAKSQVIQDHFADLNDSQSTGANITEIFVHGWVYDVETGKVSDLSVSVGPSGHEIPYSPFPKV
ncbi:carbonic anhydrase [Crepidotus variabilis]|uniref:Carbonic anhydrase n=1 Tax=Crepidotus variabilis TaxID=179855 RepID=A0A9P6JMZ7_9AGAR|nr:carbonic anhydrase [Crepidotus variabilis]